MSISGTHITDWAASGSTADLVSGTITPNLNRLYLLTVYQTYSGTYPWTPSISSTTGLTFSSVASVLAGGFADTQITVFRAMISSGASAGTITVGTGGGGYDLCMVSLDEFNGVDTSGSAGSAAVVQSATGSTNTAFAVSATLAAFGSASNGTFAAGGWENISGFNITAVTGGAGWTQLLSEITTQRYNIDTNWRPDNNTVCTLTETDDGGIGSRGAIIAIELKASGGGGGGGGGAGQPNSMLQFGIGA